MQQCILQHFSTWQLWEALICISPEKKGTLFHVRGLFGVPSHFFVEIRKWGKKDFDPTTSMYVFYTEKNWLKWSYSYSKSSRDPLTHTISSAYLHESWIIKRYIRMILFFGGKKINRVPPCCGIHLFFPPDANIGNKCVKKKKRKKKSW